MKLKEAIKILKDHNTWRRFDGVSDLPIESYPSMSAPRDLGIAIDTVVKHFETQNIVNNCEDSVIGRLSSELNKKLEDYIIEGLKRKGLSLKTD